MPFLTFGASLAQARANAASATSNAEFVIPSTAIEIQAVRNVVSATSNGDFPAIPSTAIETQVVRDIAPVIDRESSADQGDAFVKSTRRVFGCQPTPVDKYLADALAGFITPRGECAPRTFASNAALRAELAEMLALHPDGEGVSVAKRIEALGFPSLLRDDDPKYLPGTLGAMRYDVGANAIRLGRFKLPQTDPYSKAAAFRFAGECELAHLRKGDPVAPLVREDHASILDFHYRAAGMRGHTALPPTGYINAAQDETHLSDFTAHLTRCRRLERPSRSILASRLRVYPVSPLDTMQTGPACVIL
ncbi:hypothetical protein [Pandoraea commovens]|uniref:Uncharacterized protein n=1 Tax=Pandoraea commovens TaxID=2508289 RepID=A0ABY5QC65_9BURK|nr:hypothetical protein [Pandoraea commovens]UVA78244.1 hypothetical protein NTU39_19530 [Pandoraea commovens]